MEFEYQSPLEGDDRLGHAVTGNLSMWSIKGGAMVVLPKYSESWPAGLRAWYTARRDANLLGSCPLCGALGPAVRAGGVTLGQMVHEEDCAIVDPAWESRLMAVL